MLQLAQDPDADALLDRDPLALLIGMLLDQQFPMERAFAGPAGLARRLGVDRLDARALAEYDPEALAAVFTGPPALHRYPAAMAGRVQALAALLVDRYDGDAAALWRDAPDGATLLRRLKALPGFGAQKAQIFVALLGKQRGVTPPGWREAAGAYGDDGSFRSVADVVDGASLVRVREFKQAAKAQKKARRHGAEPARATVGARSRCTAVARWVNEGAGRRFGHIGAVPHRRGAIVSQPQRRPDSSSPDPVLITDAARSYEEELEGPQAPVRRDDGHAGAVHGAGRGLLPDPVAGGDAPGHLDPAAVDGRAHRERPPAPQERDRQPLPRPTGGRWRPVRTP